MRRHCPCGLQQYAPELSARGACAAAGRGRHRQHSAHLFPPAGARRRRLLERHFRPPRPDTDFILYNIPQLSGVALTLPLFLTMRKNPRVIGVKNSSLPAQDIQMFKHAGGEDCVIFNGPDEQFVSGRAIGADAGIGGTYGVMPELFLKMDALIRGKPLRRGAAHSERRQRHHRRAVRLPRQHVRRDQKGARGAGRAVARLRARAAFRAGAGGHAAGAPLRGHD